MGIVKAVHSKASIGVAIAYIERKEKTNITLIEGIDCNPTTAISEMQTTKKLWHKTDGRQYDHYIHSFAPDENITQEVAQEISLKWAKELFPCHEVVVATHTDRHHIHSHIIVNSVNHKTGKKIHTSAKWLEEAKERCNAICFDYGFKPPEAGMTFEGKPRTEAATFETRRFRTIQKHENHIGKSYLVDMGISVLNAIDNSCTKEDFINSMVMDGYSVEWIENRKNIVIKDGDGHKVRLNTLGSTFNKNFSKEALENEFRRRENTRKKENASTERNINWAKELNFTEFAKYGSRNGELISKDSFIGSAKPVKTNRSRNKPIFHSNIQANRGNEDRSR